MKPTILAYNIPASKLQSMRVLTVRMGIQLIPVKQEDQDRILASFFQEGVVSEMSVQPKFTEEMLVLCAFSQGLLDLFLNELKRKRGSVALKAALTPTNQNWNAKQLYEEISKEHAAMMQK